MANSTIKNVALTALSSVVGNIVKNIDDQEALYGSASKVKQLKQHIGFGTRYIAPEDVTAADLAIEAAQRLFTEYKLDKDTLDAMIFVVQTPDYILPATAHAIHHQLELPKTCGCFDINLGCSGYVYGLWVAASLLAANGYKKVLLLVGDTPSKHANPQDKTLASLFSDSACATLLEYAEGDAIDFSLHSDGSGLKSLYIPAGGFREPITADKLIPAKDKQGNMRAANQLIMQGEDILNFTLNEVAESIQDFLTHAHLSEDDLDHFFVHQPNRLMVNALIKTLGFDQKKFVSTKFFNQYANLSSCSVPLSMSFQHQLYQLFKLMTRFKPVSCCNRRNFSVFC